MNRNDKAAYISLGAFLVLMIVLFDAFLGYEIEPTTETQVIGIWETLSVLVYVLAIWFLGVAWGERTK